MLRSNSNGNSSISSTDQAIFHRPFLNDISPNSKQEDPPLSLFHFPSPFIPYEDDDVFLQHHHDLLLQHQQPLTTHNTVSVSEVNMLDSNKNMNEIMGDGGKKKSHRLTSEQTTPRKRSSKRDRHSKINTAQGPRDRRMRLSLEIARQFFDLQDMLGFDKASKTVEWLLSKSKAAIKEQEHARGLPPQIMNGSNSGGGAKSASSTSECEVVSGINETAINQGRISKEKPSTCVTKEKKIRQSRKAAFHTLARESREKARARARERTKEKIWSRSLHHESKLFTEAANQDINQVGSWSPFGTGEESGSQSHNMNPPPLEGEEQPSSHDQGEHLGTSGNMVDDSLAVSMGKWSPSSIFNYLQNMQNTGIFQEVSSNNNNIDSARTYSSYCAMTSMHPHPSTGNVQDGIPNNSSNFLTAPYNCLQHQFTDFQF